MWNPGAGRLPRPERDPDPHPPARASGRTGIRARAARALSAAALAAVAACRQAPALEAERAAPVGSEFIRLFPDGHAEYGYGVVKENLKAQGGYRYAQDTVWFLSEAFKPHFPAGYLPIKGGVLFMESGLHFKIKKNALKE